MTTRPRPRRPARALAPPAIALAALGAIACDDDEDTAEDGGTAASSVETGQAGAGFTVDLSALSDSGVSGTATAVREEGGLAVRHDASGLEPGMHPAHIHVPVDGSECACPTPEADAAMQGGISLEEGLPAYGPVHRPLTPFQEVGDDGTISFERTYRTDEDLEPLTRGAIALHGATVDSRYVGTLPVACGVPD